MDVPAVVGRECLEDGLQRLNGRRVAADHHPVAVDHAPDPAAHTGVDEVDAALFEHLVAALGILEVGVAAVDDRVFGGQQRGELLESLLGRVACGNHQPDDARRGEHCDHVGRSEAALETLADDLLGLVDGAVVRDHPNSLLMQPPGHVAAHAAEPDDRQLHRHVCQSASIARGSVSAFFKTSRSVTSPSSGSADRLIVTTGSS